MQPFEWSELNASMVSQDCDFLKIDFYFRVEGGLGVV